MEDERLADLLEELTEAEQLRMIEGLDLERLVSVLEEMEYDDAADLLAEMSGEQRTQVLGGDGRGRRRHAAPPALLRRGHRRRPHEPRRHHPRPELHRRRGARRASASPSGSCRSAAQVFVTQPPWVPPTGRFLGVVHFQRLLREAARARAGPLRRARSRPYRPT